MRKGIFTLPPDQPYQSGGDIPLDPPRLRPPSQHRNIWNRLGWGQRALNPQLPTNGSKGGFVRRLKLLPRRISQPRRDAQVIEASPRPRLPETPRSLHHSISNSFGVPHTTDTEVSRGTHAETSSIQMPMDTIDSPSLATLSPEGSSQMYKMRADAASDSSHPEIHAPRRIRPKSNVDGRSESMTRHGSKSRTSSRGPSPSSAPRHNLGPPQHIPTIPPRFLDNSDFHSFHNEPFSAPVTSQPDYTKTGSPVAGATLTQNSSELGRGPFFESEVQPLSQAWKDFNRMPWVSPGRITVSYRPGLDRGGTTIKVSRNGKKRVLPKTRKSWYPKLGISSLLDARSVGSSPKGRVKYVFSPLNGSKSIEQMGMLSDGTLSHSSPQHQRKKSSQAPHYDIGWSGGFSHDHPFRPTMPITPKPY